MAVYIARARGEWVCVLRRNLCATYVNYVRQCDFREERKNISESGPSHGDQGQQLGKRSP